MKRLILLVVFVSGCGAQSQSVEDPIPGIPPTQQRTIARHDLDWQWPLTVGTGTLGCASGAVVFRTSGATYAVNDAARAKGLPSIERVQVTVSGGPTNPLARVNQDTRMQIFARAVACNDTARDNPGAASICRQRVRDTHGLSEDDLKQVEAEGRERHWRPLPPEYKSLAPLIAAGLKLCPQ